LARAACATVFALVLANACGGQSFKNGGGEAGDAGSGGSNAVSGSSSGGEAYAGSSTKGGEAHAGSSTKGGSSASGGGSIGGAPPFMSACAGPSTQTGDGSFCAAYIRRWTHDVATGLCMPVVYGGCGATKNNYETLEACQKACPGGAPNYDACKLPSDCVLGETGCCGVCDGPNVSKHDFIAYNKANEAKVVTCGSGDVACGACPNPEGQTTRQFFIPNCVNGECVVDDLRESDVTACKSPSDCKLRNGTACCEGCSIGNLVSVRKDGSFEKLVCGDEITPCLACVPPLPSDAVATCEPDGHCGITYLLK
jgi:hypothetical protein